MNAHIDPEQIARVLKDERAIIRPHRQYRPDGMRQPTPWEMRLMLAFIVIVVFACFWVAPR